MSKSLAIASGKGGVGKTTIAVNLAITQSKISRCLLLDADMGMANAHILCRFFSEYDQGSVLHGK